jgi:hypothetical protein
MSFQGDPFCEQHGLIGHVAIHEAGHAVAAVEHGLAFDSVAILQSEDLGTDHPDGLVAGGVTMSSPPSEWVPGEPLLTFKYVLAGTMAERALLGHELPRGFAGDIRVWREGMGFLESLGPELLESATGSSVSGLVAEGERWAKEAAPRIRRIARMLASGQRFSRDAIVAACT